MPTADQAICSSHILSVDRPFSVAAVDEYGRSTCMMLTWMLGASWKSVQFSLDSTIFGDTRPCASFIPHAASARLDNSSGDQNLGWRNSMMIDGHDFSGSLSR